ncbi:MAG: 3-oxoacyl-ACP reductase [Gammaproteobacteria bacterium]|jgi:3-oxoacyl-[acyl-carrier protein] reductase|nr:3-oxoacyl-ACP reductase [Gammaproteobacteria bacterium]
MSQNLKDKVAIVTGGAGGIGSRIAKTYAGAGAKVVIASRSQGKLDKVAGKIDGEVLALATDVTVPEQVDNMVAKTIDEFGGIDILVNNAGGAMFIKSPNDLEPNEWDAAIALNLSSVFLCSRAVSNNMMERGSGRIINISSVAGMRLSPSFVHYGAAKAGVINLTKGLAMSWAPNNINVNCIAPGLTATEGVANWLPEKTKEDGTSVPPLLYPPDPEHVADLALFLASELSAHISGELFPIRSLTELA